MRNKRFVIGVFVLLLLGIISLVIADDIINQEEKMSIDWIDKQTTKSPNINGINIPTFDSKVGEYGEIKIKTLIDSKPILKVELKNNSDSCGQECFAIKDFELQQNTSLVDAVRFYRNINGKWALSNIRDYQLYIYTANMKHEVADYGFIGNDTKNWTIIGSHNEELPIWSPYNKGKVLPVGNYTLKLIGHKKPSWTYDWQILTNGVWTTQWAIWGNISLGDDAEVILNSPNNDNISLSRQVSFNCSANITDGAVLTNISLWSNSTGNFGIRNTTNLFYWSNGSGETTYNPQTFTTPENFFDENDSSFAVKSQVDGTQDSLSSSSVLGYLGKTFSERNVTSVKIKVEALATVSGTDCLGSRYRKTALKLYTYNGVDWIEHSTLDSDSVSGSYGTTTSSYDSTTTINNNIQGIAILFNSTAWTEGCNDQTSSAYAKGYTLEYMTYTETNTEQTWNYTINDSTLWTCQACDSDGDCGFATENRTINLDEVNFTIHSPPTSSSSKTFNLNATIDAEGSLSYCYYNITRGASTEVSNKALNCSNFTDSVTVSSYADYVLNIWANQSGGISNSTHFSFSVSEYVAPIISGGGGGSPEEIEELVRVGICNNYPTQFDDAWGKFKENPTVETFKILWDAFWDRTLCDSAGSIVPRSYFYT